MRTSDPSYITKRAGDAEWTFAATVNGHRFSQKVPVHLTARADAARWARARVKELRAESSRTLAAEYLRAIQRKRTGCTIGDVCARVSDPTQQTRKSPADQRRLVNCLRLVLAHAHNLWSIHAGGVAGVKIGARVPDKARIDALPATVLNAETVRKYFMACLNVTTLNWREVHEGANSINSILAHARGCFQGLTKDLLEGLVLPDLAGFLSRRLKTPSGKPEPVEAEVFAKVVELFDALKETRRDLWLCNLVIRQTGLRSLSSAMQIHRTWMRRLADGWWLDVEGKTEYAVPISDELAAEMLKREGHTFEGSSAQRRALLDEHTALLKGIIGAGDGGQVNHRLRDTVASACYHWLGIAVAQEALGHADEKTTRAHYARRMDVSPLMRAELHAWRRVLPGNVVGMQAAA